MSRSSAVVNDEVPIAAATVIWSTRLVQPLDGDRKRAKVGTRRMMSCACSRTARAPEGSTSARYVRASSIKVWSDTPAGRRSARAAAGRHVARAGGPGASLRDGRQHARRPRRPVRWSSSHQGPTSPRARRRARCIDSTATHRCRSAAIRDCSARVKATSGAPPNATAVS